MTRKKNFPGGHFPFHVTARTRDRESFPVPQIDAWDLFSYNLYVITLSYGVRIHAFVLMRNHFHLILSAPGLNLDSAIDALLKGVNHAISSETGNPLPVFNGQYEASQIANRTYYGHAYKYVYRNPVEARICARVEAYPYSSLRGVLGWDSYSFPAFDNMNMITNPYQKLSWLNSPFPNQEFLEEIRRAMKSPVFVLSEEGNSLANFEGPRESVNERS